MPNVHGLQDELGDQVRLAEIAAAGHCMQMGALAQKLELQYN